MFLANNSLFTFSGKSCGTRKGLKGALVPQMQSLFAFNLPKAQKHHTLLLVLLYFNTTRWSLWALNWASFKDETVPQLYIRHLEGLICDSTARNSIRSSKTSKRKCLQLSHWMSSHAQMIMACGQHCFACITTAYNISAIWISCCLLSFHASAACMLSCIFTEALHNIIVLFAS